jgi:hypothetical protein
MQAAIRERDVGAIKEIWDALVPEMEDTTFDGFLSDSPEFERFSYREIFGQVDFGTGGWDTDFPNSILEILRGVYTGADDEHRTLVRGPQSLPLALWRRAPAQGEMEEDLRRAARRIGEVMTARLRELAARFEVIGDVRGRGAMIALELVEPGTKTPDPEATQHVARACHAEGLVVLTCGTFGNVLRFLPPLVMPEHLLEEGLDILERAFADAGHVEAPSTVVETPA